MIPRVQAVLLCLAALLPAAASAQPPVGDWVKPVAAALQGEAGGRGEAPVFGRVAGVDVVLEGGTLMELRWSNSAAEFLADLHALEARAKPEGEGHDRATGLNRFVQNLGARGFAATEHWMDYGGAMRRVTVYSASRTAALEWLVAFETYRRAGGFGGTSVVTPPQSPSR